MTERLDSQSPADKEREALVSWCDEMATWCELEDHPENERQFTERDRKNWIACSALLSARSAVVAFKDGIEAAAVYCERTLAGNHPSLAHAYRHAATNIRAFADFNAAPQEIATTQPSAEGPVQASRPAGAAPVTRSATEEFSALAAFMVKEDADVDICYPGNHGGAADKWLVTVMRGHLISEHFGATLAEAVANATDNSADSRGVPK